MSGLDIEPWEPEETIGKLWHSFASRLDAPAALHEDARVTLDEVAGRVAVLFRGLGGGAAVEIRAAAPEAVAHRLSFRRKLGTIAERVPRASFDGGILRLPPEIAAFPDRSINAALYLWLAAAAAHSAPVEPDPDPLRADLAAIRAAETMTRATLDAAPGLRGLHEGLAHAALALRPARRLPAREAAVEALVRHALGDPAPLADAARELRWADPAKSAAPRDYHAFEPVALWPDLRSDIYGNAATHDDEDAGTSGPQEGAQGSRKAKRRRTDQAERKDSLILHKFEAILSWADFINLNRRVEDDDLDSAKKAADDVDEIALGQITKSPATRLKIHLDLAPSDVDRERLSAVHTYPEWDHKAGGYLPDHCRVLAVPAEPAPDAVIHDPAALRRIRAVRRRFEALRPRRVVLPKQIDGDELDLDEVIRSTVDLSASGHGSNRIWRASRNEARDLAVSILLDVSRSTESAVGDRIVIDIAREALTAFAWGLQSCGDDCAINAFSSLKRDRVYVSGCKGFDEPMSAAVEARIAGLRPGFYTRLGAAVRHASKDLATRASQRRLLIVITDGKPNDLDHYEGRHGIEDSRMAIREARRTGQSVYGIAVDAEAKSWFPRIFGRGGFTVIHNADRLTEALPGIYRHIVGE